MSLCHSRLVLLDRDFPEPSALGGPPTMWKLGPLWGAGAGTGVRPGRVRWEWVGSSTCGPHPGTAGGGEEALRERRAPAWGAVVRHVQGHRQLAAEDRGNPGAGGGAHQEHLLSVLRRGGGGRGWWPSWLLIKGFLVVVGFVAAGFLQILPSCALTVPVWPPHWIGLALQASQEPMPLRGSVRRAGQFSKAFWRWRQELVFWVKAVCGNSEGPAGQVTPVPPHVQVFSRPGVVCASCPPGRLCAPPGE